ncbi:hypothetical protein CEP54_009684 [Fusarium duplospermum]|uniref:Uncharacterized protein n=1 Tax=Fusarium duplospermum TaxID=1325734 RepID=A0A428PP00_9HYPO|nr:hypothetical protein CEP54_009684 [Fusarium duplospermum]
MAKSQLPVSVRPPPAAKTASARRPVPCNTALPVPPKATRPAASAQRPVGLPQRPKIPQRNPSRPPHPPPNRPLPIPPRHSQRPTAQPTKKPVGYKPVPPPKDTPKPSVVKKQPAPNKGMRMDDVKHIQQAAYAQGQKAGRKSSQDRGYQAGDKHGRKVGQEAGKREGFSKGQKQGYTQGHKSGHASGRAQSYAQGQNFSFNARQKRGHATGRHHGYSQGQREGFCAGQTAGYASGHRKGYYQGQNISYYQDQPFGYHHEYQRRQDEEQGINRTAVAGGVVAGTALGGGFMYLGHEALDPDGLSQVTEETETVTTEMEMSDDEFAPGEPVEVEDWYKRHGTDEIPDQDDGNYTQFHEGYLRYGDERFYEDGAYISGGYDDSDGYDTNRDGGDDSQVHLGKEYEADRRDFSGGDDDIDEKGRGYESECDCDNCCDDCGRFWGCGGQDDKKGNGSSCVIM